MSKFNRNKRSRDEARRQQRLSKMQKRLAKRHKTGEPSAETGAAGEGLLVDGTAGAPVDPSIDATAEAAVEAAADVAAGDSEAAFAPLT